MFLRYSESCVPGALVQCFPAEPFIAKLDVISVLQSKDQMLLSLPEGVT